MRLGHRCVSVPPMRIVGTAARSTTVRERYAQPPYRCAPTRSARDKAIVATSVTSGRLVCYRCMIITCATIQAAAQVLTVLMAVQLRVDLDYRVDPPDGFGPPITFTILVELPADVLGQLRAIPDTTIT